RVERRDRERLGARPALQRPGRGPLRRSRDVEDNDARDAAARGRTLRRQQDLGRGDRAPLRRRVRPVGDLRPHRTRASRGPPDVGARVLGVLQPARRRAHARALHCRAGRAQVRHLLRGLRQSLGLPRPRARPYRAGLRAARSGGGLSPMLRDVVRIRDKPRIHYRRLGQGPGTVLLHGYPPPRHLWRKAMPARAPTYDVSARPAQVSARARWHWFFHQLPDLPEALTAGREEIYLRYMYRTSAYNPAAIEEEAVQEYVRCFREPGAMRAAFDDYRAGATIDLEQDGADRDKKVAAPTLILWGDAGGRRPQVPDMLGVWKERCVQVVGHAVSGSGHFIPEEQPAAVIEAILRFVGEAGRG